MQRLLVEADDAIRLIDADDSKSARVEKRDLDCGKRGIRISLQVKPEHLRVVHLVHVIA
jgi:hypothetical protein